MDRPVVVNSLLCFIHNFRSQPILEVYTKKYFSKSLYEAAHSTLIEIITDQVKEIDDELCNAPLLELYDKAISILDPAPIFVASDLTSLPMVLISDQHQRNLNDEIIQLRFFIQSKFSSDLETKKYPSIWNLSALSNKVNMTESNEKETDRATPMNLSMTSRRSPSEGEAEASTQPLSQVVVVENAVAHNNENAESPVTKTVSPLSSPKKPRKHAPYRLDRAVRKLTDRLEATKECESPKKSTSQPASITKSEPQTPVRSTSAELVPTDTSSNTSSSENHKPLDDPVSTSVVSSFGFAPALNGNFDPLSLMMFNSFTNFNKNHANKSSQKNVSDRTSVDDEIVEDNDKMSNESSPTPSDSSNGKEYKNDTDNKHDGKIYTCEQPNCTKSFANKFLLKKHQFIHTGLRPHECPYCQKKFNRKDNLLRHKKTHQANAQLHTDGRRRHHALLPPAPMLPPSTFDPLALLKISHSQNNNEESEGVKFEAISP